MSSKERLLLLVLAGINFANIVDFMIMMPLQEYLTPVFHINTFQFSMLVASYSLAAFVSSFFMSFFSDRYDRKMLLLIGFSGFLLGTAGCAFAPSYELLMASRIVAGLFGGMIGAQVQAIVGDLFEYERRGRAMGALMGAFAAAAVIGVPAGLWIASAFTWNTPFLFIAAFGLLLLPAIVLVIPSMNKHMETKVAAGAIYSDLWKDVNMRRALMMMFMLILGHFAVIPFIAPFMENNLDVDRDGIALMYMIGGLFSIVASAIIGKLTDKHGKHRIFSIMIFLSFIPVLLLTNLPKVSLPFVLAVSSLFFFLAGGRMIPAQALITSVVKPHQRGGFLNLNSSLMQLATGLAAFIAGMIVSKDTNGNIIHYPIVGVLAVGFGLACYFISRKVKAVDV